MPREPHDLLDVLRKRGETAGRDLRSALRISQPTLSRLVRTAGDRVLQIGRARATRYALARDVRTLGSSWPVHRIDTEGRANVAGHLRAIHPGGWWFESFDPVLRRLHDGVAPALPGFLQDLRPQGFLGEAFARRHAAALSLASSPDHWDDDGILTALLVHGHDVPGDLVVGDQALDRVRPDDLAIIPEAQRPAVYAARALSDDVSSPIAGGTHAKFAACVRGSDGTVRHVLVKFAAEQRAADLLRCEHLAAVVLRAHGVAACDTEWLEDGVRSFLEVRRFDRVGTHGRLGSVSLRALLGAEIRQDWPAAVDALRRADLVSHDGAETLYLVWWLAQLIGKADLHFGSVRLMLDAGWPLRVAPLYGMGPTSAEPVAHPMPGPVDSTSWRTAAAIAEEYWSYVAEDSRVSDELRIAAARALDATVRVGRV